MLPDFDGLLGEFNGFLVELDGPVGIPEVRVGVLDQLPSLFNQRATEVVAAIDVYRVDFEGLAAASYPLVELPLTRQVRAKVRVSRGVFRGEFDGLPGGGKRLGQLLRVLQLDQRESEVAVSDGELRVDLDGLMLGGRWPRRFPLVAHAAAKVVGSVGSFCVDFDSFAIGDDGIDGQAGDAVQLGRLGRLRAALGEVRQGLVEGEEVIDGLFHRQL